MKVFQIVVDKDQHTHRIVYKIGERDVPNMEWVELPVLYIQILGMQNLSSGND